MDFSLSEAQTEIAGLARKILAEQDSAAAAVGRPRRGRRARRRAARAARRRGPWLPRAVLGARGDRPGRVAGALPFVARARRGRDRRVRHRGAAAPVGRAGRGRLGGAHRRAGGGGQRSIRRRRRRAPSARAARGGWRLSGVKTAVPAAAAGRSRARPGDGDRGRADAGQAGGEVLVFLVEPSDHGVGIAPQELTDSVTARRGGRRAPRARRRPRGRQPGARRAGPARGRGGLAGRAGHRRTVRDAGRRGRAGA